MESQIIRAIEAVHAASPLVHSITNFVVMNVTANALLAAHASPLMAHAAEEMDDLTDIDSALVLNIGTLDPAWLDSMELAGKLMRAKGKPVVLDPVGAGASHLRTEASLRLLDMVRPQIVRGNASEIMALADAICRAERLPSPSASACSDTPATKGVDSLNDSREAVESARFLASRFSCVVSISGERDFVTDGQTVLAVEGGSPLMPLVTGMGCSASAVTGAYAACAAPLVAAAAAMAVFASAGEKAAALASGPGTFLPHFLDELYKVSSEDAARRVRTVAI
jgi:hydroxyethylthiazole kinase